MKSANLTLVLLVASLVMLVIALCTGCASHRLAPSPQYAGIVTKSEDITKTINLATEDSKEVRKLQRDSLSLVDRLDFKASRLLEK